MILNVDDVKQFLGITITTDDDLLLELTRAVIKQTENKCNRTFEADEYTEYYDGKYSSELQLNVYPVSALTSVHDDVDRVYGSDTLIDSSDLVLYGEEGIIYYDGDVFSDGRKNVKVVYTAGYTVNTIPPDLKQGLIELIGASYIEAKGGINAIESETTTYKPYNLRKHGDLLTDKYIRYV
jgi:uncharacterized phiE125 gp8 family phage protein